MLDVIGLNPGEEELYRSLVQLTTARVEELVKRLRRPHAEVVAQLDTLRGKGLVLPAGPEPDAPLRPLAPDVPLGEALLRRQEALEAARAAVTQLTEEYRAGMRRHDADHLVEVITGARVLRERLRDVQNGAQVEVLWFCRANPLAMSSEENVEEFDALARGVRYRAIYEREMLLEPGGLEHVERGVRAGEQARMLDRLPVRLAIVDSGEPSAAVIGRSQLLDVLLALFESYWRIATPVRSAAPPADGQPADGYRPDADEVRLLSLFVAGVPDKSIASQLGVSRRTVQRRLADLMTVAGVDTRPGLAFQAARQGWL